MIRRKKERQVETKENLRGGVGKVQFAHLLAADETGGRLKLAAVLTFPPGASVGEHPHADDAELYWMIEGKLTATDNNENLTFTPGDVIWTDNGSTHSLRNESDKPAKLLAIIVR